jgi:hypothetical protein
MTKRQLSGFAVFCFAFLANVFVYWLAHIYGYNLSQWAVRAGATIIAIAWGLYFRSDFARRE